MSANKSKKDKLWYRGLKMLVRIRYRRPKFEYSGEKPTGGTIVVCNHEGAAVPLLLATYPDFPLRMWGTAEMNSGLKKLYKYESEIYYHEKRHMNLFLSKLICLVVSPLTHLFYKGLKVISTYGDARLLATINESLSVIKNDNDNIVIYPEDSSKGYKQKLEQFYAGFVVLAQSLYKQGVDVPIFAAYYKKKENKFCLKSP